jgi:hypothetical protein
MPNRRRGLILLLVLGLGWGASTIVQAARQPALARWPTDDAVFAVPGWTVGPQQSDLMPTDDQLTTGAIVQRAYRTPGGSNALLAVWTIPQPQAKTLFRKGPDRDFLGAGYVTKQVALPHAIPGGGALIATQGQERWLLLYTFGEQRGLLGSGVSGWAWAELDALLDRPNDYFLARLSLPLQDQERTITAGLDLADSLFPRLAGWYSTPR